MSDTGRRKRLILTKIKRRQNNCLHSVLTTPYEKVSEGHHAPLTGFVSAGYAGRAGGFG